jgi:hypothetical protein
MQLQFLLTGFDGEGKMKKLIAIWMTLGFVAGLPFAARAAEPLRLAAKYDLPASVKVLSLAKTPPA